MFWVKQNKGTILSTPDVMLMFILVFFLPAASSSSATCLSPLPGTRTHAALPPRFLCSLSLLSNWPCTFPAASVQLIRPQYLNSLLPSLLVRLSPEYGNWFLLSCALHFLYAPSHRTISAEHLIVCPQIFISSPPVFVCLQFWTILFFGQLFAC